MVNIEEGIYMIWNAYNNNALDLSNGEWNYGQVQTWESHNDARDSGAQYNQRWLIAKVPGTSDQYHIINAHYGVLAGGFNGERFGNWRVKAGPISTDGACTRWTPEDVNGLIRFKWGMDNTRCLDIDNGDAHGAALIWQTSTNDSKNQLWRLQRDDGLDNRSNSWSGWMSNVPDDTKLSVLNIPGTHQSLATHRIFPSDNPHCQERPPYEQLCEGIRSLDNRFDRWTGANEQWNLYARHGVASMGYSCAALLQSLKIFLQRFPREVVFINISNETGTDGFRESWDNDYKFFRDIFYNDGRSEAPHLADMTIGAVRGKVISSDMIWQTGSLRG